MKPEENRVRVGQRWDPELLARAQAAADELGQTLTTFTERAIAAHLAALKRSATPVEQAPAATRDEPAPLPEGKRRRSREG